MNRLAKAAAEALVRSNGSVFQMPWMDHANFVATGHKLIRIFVHDSKAAGRHPHITGQQEGDFHDCEFVGVVSRPLFGVSRAGRGLSCWRRRAVA